MEEKSLKDEIRELTSAVKDNLDKEKSKKFRMPFRGKVGKAKLKRGYVTVIVMRGNKNIEITKEPIVDNTIKIEDTYHAVNNESVFLYKGKPLMIIVESKLNPYNPLAGKNETYGQKYIMAKMLKDQIAGKKMKWSAALIIGIIVAGIVGYYFLSGGTI